MSEALLVVGHGTRSTAGQAQCAELIEVVRARRPQLRVELGYLELCPPPIHDVVQGLADDGVDDVTVVPLVLLAAGHAKGDVPAAIERERRTHAGMSFRYGRALGLRPELLSAIDDRVAAATPEADRSRTSVLLVGRGTSDPDANGDLAKAARMLWENRPWAMVEPAFVSLAEPSVPQGLDRLRALGAERVVVVPWFLFTGILEERIRAQTAAWSAEHPGLEAVNVPEMGPDPRIADLLLDRYDEARAGGAIANCDGCLYRTALPGLEGKVGLPQTLHHHPDDDGTHDHGHDHAHAGHGHGHASHDHADRGQEPAA